MAVGSRKFFGGLAEFSFTAGLRWLSRWLAGLKMMYMFGHVVPGVGLDLEGFGFGLALILALISNLYLEHIHCLTDDN